MPRPVILGVVGDSAAGKTTLTRGLVRILGEEMVTHVSTDDYHRYDRKQRAELGITPLHPDCNYVDIMSQALQHLRRGEPILKPVYRHADGTFGPPVYTTPNPFTVVEGLLGYHTQEMRDCYDGAAALDPASRCAGEWRSAQVRCCTRRQELAELDRRGPASAQFTRRPSGTRTWSSPPAVDDHPGSLDAELPCAKASPTPTSRRSSATARVACAAGLRSGRGGHERQPRPRARHGLRGGAIWEKPIRLCDAPPH